MIRLNTSSNQIKLGLISNFLRSENNEMKCSGKQATFFNLAGGSPPETKQIILPIQFHIFNLIVSFQDRFHSKKRLIFRCFGGSFRANFITLTFFNTCPMAIDEFTLYIIACLFKSIILKTNVDEQSPELQTWVLLTLMTILCLRNDGGASLSGKWWELLNEANQRDFYSNNNTYLVGRLLGGGKIQFNILHKLWNIPILV